MNERAAFSGSERKAKLSLEKDQYARNEKVLDQSVTRNQTIPLSRPHFKLMNFMKGIKCGNFVQMKYGIVCLSVTEKARTEGKDARS